MDELLDLALPHVADPSRIDMLDVGSGCGRLALYVALTRPWQVHGVEISPVLHHEAAQALAKGYQGGYFTDLVDTDSTSGSIHLHAGAAEEWTDILRRCNVIFAYSTAWPTCRFSEQWGAMIIGQQWSGLLSQSCARGTVVVTTDRALDPQYGWDLVDTLDVDNREVMGSAGYVHVLRC
jgi:SAM-dependent methyltransferase